MPTSQWLGAPLGPQGRRWRTFATERSVLAVVHTVTAANRLADILPVFDSDRRVQIVFTCPGASAVTNGVHEHLAATGALIMPWDQAVSTRFDLALSVHNSGDLHKLDAPLIVLSHGMGYTKYSARSPEPGARSPEPGARSPEPGARSRSVYGLSRESLVRDGVVVPRAIVLSHKAEYARLSAAAPEALGSAVVAGDPCLDRMAASESYRRDYRHTLGAGDDTQVVLVTSTWGPDSLLGRAPDLIARLLAEFPGDGFRVAAVLHPNTWFGHGPAQVRLWLSDCLRAGLRLVPPAEGWQQAVMAADVVIGDHGAVTAYAACAHRPTLLASFPDDQVAPGSAVAALGRLAPRLDLTSMLAPQLDAAAAAPDRFAEVRELSTSLPGRSAAELRSLFYELMRLPEPDREPLVLPYPPAGLVPEELPVAAWWAAAGWSGEREVVVTRWPADVESSPDRAPRTHDRHLVVKRGHPRRDLYGNAAVIQVDRLDQAEPIFAERPACVLVVAGNRIVHRAGGIVSVGVDGGDADEFVVLACASAIRAWLSHGHSWHSVPQEFMMPLGARSARVSLTDQSAR